jgi:23S rRNA (uridine2552-2'-O)-methyltransferase
MIGFPLVMKKNRWDDQYARRARSEKWLARSVYKLEEIDRRCRIIHRGQCLLDLGCFPGSWVQYALKKVGRSGQVIGVDQIKPETLLYPNFRFIHADLLELEVNHLCEEIGAVDVVLSDLAPQTTGDRSTDAARSLRLARRAAEIAFIVVNKKGSFVCKIFEGGEVKAFKTEISRHFGTLRTIRPSAVRKRSREIYLVGTQRV